MSRPALEGSITKWANRPICQADGCCNPAMYMYQYDDGTWKWRVRHGLIICSAHHNKTWHPTLQHRKDYCENKDGRLGYKCTTTIVWDGMLDVDHKNGKPNDNRPANLQTLCKCCHAYKTHRNKDYASPGRKALGFTNSYK
jgi:hypothetical protein